MDVRTTRTVAVSNTEGAGQRVIRIVAVLLAAVLVLATALVSAPGAWAADRAALSVSKTVSATSAEPGDRVTWSIDVTCESITTMCADVELSDLVPEPFVIDGSLTVQGQRTGTAQTAVTGNQVTVAFRETDAAGPGVVGLAAGQSVSVLVPTLLPADTGLSWDGSTVLNTVDVSASNADPVSDDASLVIAVPVTPAVDLTKSWTPSDQVAGDESDQTLTLTVANTSPIPATALTITDPAAGTDPAFGPGTAITLRGIGDWTAPQGATGVSLTLTGTAGTSTVGPFAPGEPIDTTGIDLAGVQAIALTFHGDGTTEGSLVAAGSAGSITLITGQNGTAPRDSTTTVPNTAAAEVTTARGTGTDQAAAQIQLNPVTVEVTAGKTINGTTTARVVSGQSATVRLTAQNSSNTALSTLTLTEPTGGTDPFGALADGKLQVRSLGTSPASDWPTGATEADLTLTGTGPGLPMTVTVPAPTGAEIAWPTLADGAVLTGMTLTYRGAIEPGATAALPIQVDTDPDWDTAGFPNQVTVSGEAADGTLALDRTADATLTVVPRRIVTTTSKTVTQRANGEQITGAVGQEVAARITGRISADTTVPVERLVIEDLADGGSSSTLWAAADLDRIGSVQVPSGSQAEVLVRADGVWTSIAGPSTAASQFLDLAVPDGVDGVRIVYTATSGTLPITGSFAPSVVLVMTLAQAQPVGTVLTNTAVTTGEADDTAPGLSGDSSGQANTTTGPGTTPLDIRQVDAAKSWRDAAALIGVDNDQPDATDRPTNRLTMQVQNVSGIPVGTLRLTDPDPVTAGNAFDQVDITALTLEAPTGTTAVEVVLSDVDGAELYRLTSAAQVAALTADQLREVVLIQATATGTLPDSAILRLRADTVLRATTRADGSPILGTADAPASTTLTNTLRGDLGPDTPSDPAQADTVLYPEARQPLAGALNKSVTPDSGTRYSATDRTVRLTMSARRTSDAAVSRPAQYVLEDVTPEFWDRFDLVGLSSLSAITAADGSGWTAAVEYLVDGQWSSPVTSEIQPGTTTAMPALPAGAADLPSGVSGDRVTGVRVTFTAPEGQWFANRAVGGFEGPTAIFALAPRTELRSTGDEVPADTVTNVLTGTVEAAQLSAPIVLDPVTATYTVTDGTPDATVTKSPVTTTTGPGAAVPFTLTATNTGTAPLVDPVLTDRLPTDAQGSLFVYDPQAHGAATVTGAADPTVTVTDDAITITFPPGTRLLPGERIDVLLPLAVRTGIPAGSVLTNTFVLSTAEGLTREAQATVNVVAMATYLRVKDVAEDVPVGGAPTGVVSTTGTTCTSEDGFYRNPCLVRTAPGGSETWRMRVTNTGNLPTSALTLVDVLPFPGDTGTSKSQSGSSRGSTWATEYLGDLALSGVPTDGIATVSYLLDGQTCTYTGDARSADPYGTGCLASAWTPADQVDDMSAVRGVRVDIDASATPLQPGDQVTVTFRTRSASGYDLSATDVDAPAWNTMVVSTTSLGANGPVYETLEPNRAGVAVDRSYALGDRVWLDLNKDGRQDDGEPGVGGVRVEVVPEGSDTPIATTVTDADGHWVVDGLPAGRYRVHFVLSDDLAARYGFTVTRRGSVDLDSDADPSTGWSRVVDLGPGSPQVRLSTPQDGVAADLIDPTVDAGLILRTATPPTPTGPSDLTGDPDPDGGSGTLGVSTTAAATSGGLAVTGTEVGLAALGAVVMLLIGGVLLRTRRRRG